MWTLIQNKFLIELTLERRGSLDQDGSIVLGYKLTKNEEKLQKRNEWFW